MNQDVSNPSKSGQQSKPNRRTLLALLAGTIFGGALATGIAAKAVHGPGGWGGGHRHHAHFGAQDPQSAAERAEFGVDWILSKVKASDDQRARAKTIVRDAVTELYPMRDQHLESRRALMDVLAAPSIDRQKLEELRRAELQRAESASQRIVQALADVAEVLTPPQRAELAQHAARWRR